LSPILVVLLLFAGCIPLRKGGTTHYVIVGFGVVSVPSTNSPAAQVVRSQAIGLTVSDQPGVKVGIGYASSTTVNIRTNQNIAIEISGRPGQPLKINTP
jgi:hypothetical protein